jgi:hypothetical protein
MSRKIGPWLAVASLVAGSMLSFGADAATVTQAAGYYPTVTPDTARITVPVDTSKLAELPSSSTSSSFSKYDTGPLQPGKQLNNVTLLLKRSDVKQAQFDAYIKELTRPTSQYFHHWLTRAQIGALYGPAQSDIAEATQWLKAQGLTVDEVTADGMMIRFSGSAGNVANALHTQFHGFNVNGAQHYANVSSVQIPQALSPLVRGVASLGNFFPKPLHIDVGTVARNKQTGKWQTVSRAPNAPQFTVPSGSQDPSVTYDVTPADFNVIYNVNPLWSQATPVRGAGQTIVVLEDSDVNLADVATFRQTFLPANAKGKVTLVHPTSASDTCTDPGTNSDESEAALDAEWAGAAAPDANIIVAACADTSASFGPFIAATNLLSQGVTSSIWSLSYGSCETQDPESAVTANTLWSDAAAEGITVFVSSGDAGSTACDQDTQQAAVFGSAVNGMASTPYNVAMGGTDFYDISNTGNYWGATNSALYESALSYIPEQTWNDTCASSVLDGLLEYANGVAACNGSTGFLATGGGGGGPSTLQSQPEWQIGIYGSANYASRMLPDVSLFASNGFYGHALIYCMSDTSEQGTVCNYSNPNDVYYNSAGGTSFTAPAMAGVQALINQTINGASGNILPALYNIATRQYGSNGTPNTSMVSGCNSSSGPSESATCVFNNVTVGDIDQPCFNGTVSCYTGTGASNGYGIVEGSFSSSLIESPAWLTNSGYSMATGLGSVNVSNLVAAVANYDVPLASKGYTAPADFMSLNSLTQPGGYTDIALVNSTNGQFLGLAMKGNIVLSSQSSSSPVGFTIGAIANAIPNLSSQNIDVDSLFWTGPSNVLNVWETTAGTPPITTQFAIGGAYPAGWQLIGSGVMDSTGVPKLFWFNATTSQFGWWSIGDAPKGGAPSVASVSKIFTVTPGYAPTLADVNGDGYTDIVWTGTNNSSVYVWINNQHGEFTSEQITDQPSGFTLFGAGDITGSGTTALIWTNPSTNQIQWWVMNGFNVVSQQTRSVASGYTMASIGDFNGDGLADILWVGTTGNAYVWESIGGGFQSLLVSYPDGTPYTIPTGMQVQANRLQSNATVLGQ